MQSYDIDNIRLTQSPVKNAPVIFRSGMLLNSTIHAAIQSTAAAAEKNNDQLVFFNEQDLVDKRHVELEQLSNIIQSSPNTEDEIVQHIIEQINLSGQTTDNTIDKEIDCTIDFNRADTSIIEHQSISTMVSSYPYPPISQQGSILSHDRPYADFGHLDAETIAKECQFVLDCRKPQDCHTPRGAIRMSTHSFAITCWTNVEKNIVMAEIKRQFSIQKLQYVCVAEEKTDTNDSSHLHIQIILKYKTNKKTWFLDDITGHNFIEFGSFKSVHIRGEKRWPTQSSTNIRSTTVAMPTIRNVTRTLTKAEQRQQYLNETARKAIELAKVSINAAMDFMIHDRPNEFLLRSSWYLNAFKYINLRTQEEADKVGVIDKEYIWPQSFPDCTLELRKAMNDWLENQFVRASSAKCLVLVGSSSTGKTTFAKSLPGRYNYYQESWNVDTWSDYARYTIYDNIPWDEFDKRHFPSKESLLNQKGSINATGKYRPMKTIHITQPAIVILNEHTTGSLLAKPKTEREHKELKFWRERIVLYVMDAHESFYSKDATQSQHVTTHPSPITSNKINLSQEKQMNDFDQLIRRSQGIQ
ncbi:unnamed protein product [Rotaria magnacalcarata]|uniref:Replication-associated protein n=1 Tax=Rotaria magnacalcarata TaxID=392030 RepID=A0A816FU43_9BILA|nr:unnamed protein product [Rotaria magnacalcarata]CAF1666213.1 unnamed protein product [Rotaria magnacalcarata]CAF2067050.1 unnamed protein product [Rotaria magnacalcarata]CAF4126313.1 unnamed protein product [Rotaria magnacalcarata]CAF4164380.1 unnamed protein product [Rotaria magnacalcarata]